jgi:hypothetical protein
MTRIGFVAVLLVIIAAIGAYLLFFREDPLAEALNKRWPALSADEQRQKAVDASANAIALIAQPSLALCFTAGGLLR